AWPMNGWTRVTLVGSTARGDVAVPDDEPLGALLPRLLELVGEQAGPVTRAPSLARITGEPLDPSATVSGAGLRDGEVVRLVRPDRMPHPPEVADVTEALGASRDERGGRWGDRSRQWTGIGALAALAVTGALLAARPLDEAGGPVAVLLAPLFVCAALCLVAVCCGLGRARWGVYAATAVALGVGVPGMTFAALPDRPTATGWVLPVVTAAGLLAWVCTGTTVGLVLGRRAVGVGAALGVLLLLVPLGMSSLGTNRAAAAGALAATVACGVLPRFAASAGGLTAVDDAARRRARPAWHEVQDRIDDAYAALTWCTVAVGVALVGTAGSLAASRDGWAVGLAAALLLVVALRTRSFPLTAQHVALWVAVAGTLAQGLASHAGWPLPVLAIAWGSAAALVLVLVVVRPPEHVRAVIRRGTNWLELAVVLSTVPLLVGLLGVYADLLERFR
ncbi:MAG: EsaB/YukD family protein, partial [Dermatophilaceae bacterium]